MRGNRADRVMHVCGDFAKQQIYTQLVMHLAATGLRQIVYAAVRTKDEADWRPPELADVPCHFRHILRGRHRLFFRSKIRRVVSDVAARVKLSEVVLTHAHFLYSDGAVALTLKRRFGVPYVVAVRNTDINAFLRYRPDLSRVRDGVLAEASRVVFLSHAYERLLAQQYQCCGAHNRREYSDVCFHSLGDSDGRAQRVPLRRKRTVLSGGMWNTTLSASTCGITPSPNS